MNKTLTKENFWDAIMELYPKSTTLFCKWIDEYKEAVSWNKLFKANEDTIQIHSSTYKFHEIPYAMQQGIWIAFVDDNLEKYFEQPEYTYSGDLVEDINKVFGEIEDLIEAP
jgi:hypothetical protein